jgi:hypothetical protein
LEFQSAFLKLSFTFSIFSSLSSNFDMKVNGRNAFTVGVKLLSGKSFSVMIQPIDPVAALKQRIFEKEGIPPQRQNLLVMGKLLQPDTRPLQEYSLKAGDMVYVTAGVRGHDPSPTATLPPPGTGTMPQRRTLEGKEQGTSSATSTSSAVAFGAASNSVTATASAMFDLLTKAGTTSKAFPGLVGDKGGSMLTPAAPMAPLSGSSDAKKDKETKDGSSSDRDGSGSGSVPGTDVSKIRASTIQQFAQVTTVLRPHSESITPEPANSSRWPRASQAYCVYTRMTTSGEVTGVITFGLSNPFQNTFFYAIGTGIELLLECPSEQAKLAGPTGAITGASISESWAFAIVHEIAHQCFALGLQIRQLLERLQLLSVEIAGIPLPQKYTDHETGRCCVLLGHLGEPDVPRGFNVTVPHQHQWILQSVLFVPCRLLTFAQCQQIRKEGTDARRKLAEQFVKDKTYSRCDVPLKEWPAVPVTTTGTQAQATVSNTSTASSSAESSSVCKTTTSSSLASSSVGSSVSLSSQSCVPSSQSCVLSSQSCVLSSQTNSCSSSTVESTGPLKTSSSGIRNRRRPPKLNVSNLEKSSMHEISVF